jgi:YD repeat-containing protein
VKKSIFQRALRKLAAVGLTLCLAYSALARQGGTTRYVYDENGRLHAVIAPSGAAVVYEYDAAGNITAIRRLAADELAILSFSPHEGLPGDQVTFIGVGFGSGVTEVSFNGASAAVVSVSPSQVVATVPQAATTGLVTITTPHGSVSTDTPFTIAGLRITPALAAVKFGESVQFTAEVLPATLDQTVQWSVEGIDGGNSGVGTISPGGLFTAPSVRFSDLIIRAASVVDTSRFAEAHVRVSDPNDVQTVFAAPVSVQLGQNSNTASLARSVAVQYGSAGDSQSALSKSVAVQYGASAEPQSSLAQSVTVQFGGAAESSAALSPNVSVQKGGSDQVTALAKQLSIQYEPAWGQYFPLDAVSATQGPYIQGITPGNLSRGTAVTVTINGVGLTGATAIRFINASGAIDSTVTASNISVSGDGTSLTATVSVSAGAAVGSRLVIIATPNGDSIGVDLAINRINVQ